MDKNFNTKDNSKLLSKIHFSKLSISKLPTDIIYTILMFLVNSYWLNVWIIPQSWYLTCMSEDELKKFYSKQKINKKVFKHLWKKNNHENMLYWLCENSDKNVFKIASFSIKSEKNNLVFKTILLKTKYIVSQKVFERIIQNKNLNLIKFILKIRPDMKIYPSTIIYFLIFCINLDCFEIFEIMMKKVGKIEKNNFLRIYSELLRCDNCYFNISTFLKSLDGDYDYNFINELWEITLSSAYMCERKDNIDFYILTISKLFGFPQTISSSVFNGCEFHLYLDLVLKYAKTPFIKDINVNEKIYKVCIDTNFLCPFKKLTELKFPVNWNNIYEYSLQNNLRFAIYIKNKKKSEITKSFIEQENIMSIFFIKQKLNSDFKKMSFNFSIDENLCYINAFDSKNLEILKFLKEKKYELSLFAKRWYIIHFKNMVKNCSLCNVDYEILKWYKKNFN
jgi:hypothetical protein